MGDRHPRRPRPLRHRRHRQPAAGGPANNIDELQALCDQFRWHYNHQRPHQSLGKQVPAEAYQALPKVGPGDPRPRRRKSDPRVLLVSPTGSVHYRKRKIGIGIQWKGRRVTVIDSKPDHVVVLDRTTGAVLRELILGRSGTYHRNGRKRDRSSQEPRNRTAAGASENGFEGTSVAAFNRELGVSHNLIHQRFGSKEAL